MRAETVLVVPVILFAAVLLGLLTYRLLHGNRSPAPRTTSEEDPTIEEARKVRAESREMKMRIEASSNRPSEKDWLESLEIMAERRGNGG